MLGIDSNGDMLSRPIFGVKVGRGVNFRGPVPKASNQTPQYAGLVEPVDMEPTSEVAFQTSFVEGETDDNSNLSADFTFRAIFGGFSAATNVTNAKSIKSSSFGLNLFAQKLFPAETVSDLKLSDPDQALLDDAQIGRLQFIQKYGSHLAWGQVRAAQVRAFLELGTTTSLEQLRTTANIEATYGGATANVSLAQSLRSAKKEGVARFQLSATGMEVPADLKALVPTSDSEVTNYAQAVLTWLNGVVNTKTSGNIYRLILRPWTDYSQAADRSWGDDFVGLAEYTTLFELYEVLRHKFYALH